MDAISHARGPMANVIKFVGLSEKYVAQQVSHSMPASQVSMPGRDRGCKQEMALED
jgi:hypothetical protein